MRTHDFHADTYEEIGGVRYLWNSANPSKKYEVVSLLDSSGEETDDEDLAAGGVVKFSDECFVPFFF